VWNEIWPVVNEPVLLLLQSSLAAGELPEEWRHAKIVPLKTPNKADYWVAKAGRPIYLLSTLGKVFEAVVTERVSYAVETLGLLPTNQFGARKKRFAEHALLLLQEHTYNARRRSRVLSIVSFDDERAYNEVFKKRLLQRVAARGMPPDLVRWIDAFCSNRMATILVNGYCSESRELQQAGLAEGSPLSPILFLFFNVDLVQRNWIRTAAVLYSWTATRLE